MHRFNFIIYIVFLNFCSCWWEEPQEAGALDVFTTQANFLVTPDTTDIKVNDTIWFSFEAANVFTAPSGKTKSISNGNFVLNTFLYKKASGNPDFLWERTPVTNCKVISLIGSYLLNTGSNSIQSITPVYSSGKYYIKVGFIPLYADTYWVEINAAKEERGGFAIVLNASFSNTKQNIDLLLPGLNGYVNYPSKKPYIYAFVAH